jgi:hypothetical protein
MPRYSRILALAAAAVLTIAAFQALGQAGQGVARSGPEVRTCVGETKDVGDGIMRTWVTLDQAGKPIAIGVTFTEGALSGLPDTEPLTEYALSFPPEASVTAFTHFAADWNPKGHIPPGVYDVPHFDFHFYIMDRDVREAMTGTDEHIARAMQAPPADSIPKDYQAVPGGFEPRMGEHWADFGSPELHGQPFTETFIYGFYDGKLAFIEPMITRAFLETKQGFSKTVKLPQKYPTHAYYPTRYALRYDPAGKKYMLALQGFVMR